jgi:hypothetical protein
VDETSGIQNDVTEPADVPPYVYGPGDYPDVPPPAPPAPRRCVNPAGYEVQCEPQG